MNDTPRGARSLLATFGLFALPLVLLAAVIGLFLATDGAGLRSEPAAPIESLVVERIVLEQGLIRLRIRNTGPGPLEIAQAAVKDLVLPFSMEPGRVIPRLRAATVILPYPWVKAEAYEIRLVSANSVAFSAVIEAAAETRRADAGSLLSFTLIGLYVGVIPVFLGMFWYPALKRLGGRAFQWLMALTLGLLLYLGLDATVEAIEIAGGLGGPLQGPGLAGLGLVLTFLLLDALSRRKSGLARDEEGGRRRVAAMISLGIGLHNLGEGLAIGAAFGSGAAALGAFLVIGFILQNITEGLGIVSPLLRQKPDPRFLAGLGLLGGAPAILGAWVGGFANTPLLSLLFLSIGAGAVFEVAYEIAKLIRRKAESEPMPLGIWSGIGCGMALLYLTGLLVK